MFLDEVAELSPAIQARLLRVLQERTFVPVDGTEPMQVDVRLLAATNKSDGNFVCIYSVQPDGLPGQTCNYLNDCPNGTMRSAAVDPGHRHMGLAGAMVELRATLSVALGRMPCTFVTVENHKSARVLLSAGFVIVDLIPDPCCPGHWLFCLVDRPRLGASFELEPEPEPEPDLDLDLLSVAQDDPETCTQILRRSFIGLKRRPSAPDTRPRSLRGTSARPRPRWRWARAAGARAAHPRPRHRRGSRSWVSSRACSSPNAAGLGARWPRRERPGAAPSSSAKFAGRQSRQTKPLHRRP